MENKFNSSFKTRKYIRTLIEVQEDGLWPHSGGIGDPDREQDVRHGAIAEVLCSIPESDYENLKTSSFEWFIPPYETHGMIYPFTAAIEETELLPYAKVLYLSPILEKSAWDIVLATVAHELAHLVLDHPMYGDDKWQEHEEEVFNRICEWGFEREAKKLRAVNKWRRSWEKSYVQRVIAKV